jgi:DUF1365 family protein
VTGLYRTTVRHHRSTPLTHGFQSRSHWWVVDIDALPRLRRWQRPFARFDSRDHLGDPQRPIRENVLHFLALQGIDAAGTRILMAGHARALGRVFNPLTVFWALGGDGGVRAVLAEVCNTYGERHCYVLQTDERGRASADKAFYVSPFNDTSGSYSMSLPIPTEQLDLVLTLHREGQAPFVASVQGAQVALTLRTLLASALSTRLTPVLIRRHGLLLWLRRLPVVRRPIHPVQEGV